MRIYLAGPDVFLPDAAAMADAKKAICARYGMTGVFPLDPVHSAEADAVPDRFLQIYFKNEAHIRSCDALIANLTPFRGPSADAGTVYELGFMRALGRPVLGYSNSADTFLDRTLAFLGGAARERAPGDWVDAEGMHLESFDRFDNLMIDGGILAAGGILATRAVPEAKRWSDLAAFEDCVVALARRRG